MTKTAHKGQEKKVVGASLAYAGNGIFVLRLDFSDNLNCAVVGVLAENIENLIGQIETALADNQPFFTAPNGRRFICDPSVLRKIKTLLCGASRTDAGATHTHFCSIRGDSAAQALGSSANAQLTKGATRTVRGAKQISEAAAQAVCPQNPRTSSTRGGRSLPARQISHKSGVTDSRRKSRAVRCPRGASISPRVQTKNGRTSVVVATRKVLNSTQK